MTALVFRAKESTQGGDQKHWILVDPDTFEEGLCDESITVVLDCGKKKILGISKSGGSVVGKDQIKSIIFLAERRWQELSSMLLS